MKSTVLRALWKHRLQIQTAFLATAIFVAGFVLGNMNFTSQAQGRIAITDTEAAFEPFWEAYGLIQERYVDPVDVPTVVNGAINGMVESLGDQYSSYMDPQLYAMFDTDISGDVEGIGVVIRTIEETGEIEIVNVLKNAPAETAGVRVGDIFVEVDGESVLGLNQSELAARVRGPAGSQVHVKFRRGDQFVEFDITRDRFEVPNIEYEILDNDIAYISMLDFNALASNQFKDALQAVDINNRAGLIFDVRGNPGGLLSTAIDITSAFIEDGVILYEVFGDGTERAFEANGNYANIQVPIVLLVDETSASASELLAGALKDRGAATIIGEVSFGKGTVQTIQPLSNDGALRVTIARWLSPNRNWIHELGVEPDILVDWDPETLEEEEAGDPQLDAAIEFLLGQQ